MGLSRVVEDRYIMGKMDNISTSVDEMGDILVDKQGRTYYNIGRETTDDLENLPIPKSVQYKGDNSLEELE